MTTSDFIHRAGWDACCDDLPATSNPHTPGSDAWLVWDKGWTDAWKEYNGTVFALSI